MSCEKWSFSKILPIVYSVLTLLNVSRLAYMTGITIVVSGGFNDPPPTLFQKVGMYLCVIYIILIHVALISTVILLCFEKTKPFYIVATIDFAVYVFCLIYFESQGALSEKAFVYIPACIIQAVFFFITILYAYKQNSKNKTQGTVSSLEVIEVIPNNTGNTGGRFSCVDRTQGTQGAGFLCRQERGEILK